MGSVDTDMMAGIDDVQADPDAIARVAVPRMYFRRMDLDDLSQVEFGFPGPLRDQLVAVIRSGAKTSTSGLVPEYERSIGQVTKSSGTARNCVRNWVIRSSP